MGGNDEEEEEEVEEAGDKEVRPLDCSQIGSDAGALRLWYII